MAHGNAPEDSSTSLLGQSRLAIEKRPVRLTLPFVPESMVQSYFRVKKIFVAELIVSWF